MQKRKKLRTLGKSKSTESEDEEEEEEGENLFRYINFDSQLIPDLWYLWLLWTYHGLLRVIYIKEKIIAVFDIDS